MTYTTYKTNLFLVVTLLFSFLAVAQEEPPFSFKPHVIFDKAMDVESVAVVDIDGDDRIDVLSASSEDNTIRWYKNLKTDEGIVFEVGTIFTSAMNAREVAFGDIDGDMNMDVVSASEGDNTIRWYKNLGGGVFTDEEGNFTDHTILSSAMGAFSVAVVDIDGDMDVDVLSASHTDDTIRGFRNIGSYIESDGGIGFMEYIIFNNADGATFVSVADVDGDEELEIISASENDSSIRWHKRGDEGYITKIVTDASWGVYSVATADVDGDDDLDMLSNVYFEDDVRLYKNNGMEVFTSQIIDMRIVNVYSVATADLNKDDHPDFVVGSRNIIRLYKNDGHGNFGEGIIIFQNKNETSGIVNSVVIVDLDGDEDLDIVSATHGDNTIRWHENDLISLNVEKVLPQTTTLYPNPTSSAVNLSHATATNTNYSLFDMSGKRLATYEQSGTAHQLDVSSVSKGTYILKAISGLQVNYYRIVKQ